MTKVEDASSELENKGGNCQEKNDKKLKVNNAWELGHQNGKYPQHKNNVPEREGRKC